MSFISDTPKVSIQLTAHKERLEVRATASGGEGKAETNLPPRDLLDQLVKHDPTNIPLSVLKLVGKTLYQCLMVGDVARLTSDMLEDGRRSGQSVQLELRFDADHVSLAQYPWEMITNDFDQFLVRNGLIDVTRYINYPQPPSPFNTRLQNTSLLQVVSQPPNIPPSTVIDLNIEKIETLRHATFEQFLRKLLIKRLPLWGVQFEGHGALLSQCRICDAINVLETLSCCQCKASLSDAKPISALAFERDGGIDWVPTEEFGSVLFNAKVQLATLMLLTGETVRVEDWLIFNGLTPSLIMAGVPAVVGMQYPVLSNFAINFLNVFYTTLLEKNDILTALRVARSINMRGTWYSPVLYLRHQKTVKVDEPLKSTYYPRDIDTAVPAHVKPRVDFLVRLWIRRPETEPLTEEKLRTELDVPQTVSINTRETKQVDLKFKPIEGRKLQLGEVEVKLHSPQCEITPENIRLFVDEDLDAPAAIFTVRTRQVGNVTLFFSVWQDKGQIASITHHIKVVDSSSLSANIDKVTLLKKDHIKRLIINLNRRLQKLREQRALHGISVDPKVLIEIEDIEIEIEDLQTQLKENVKAILQTDDIAEAEKEETGWVRNALLPDVTDVNTDVNSASKVEIGDVGDSINNSIFSGRDIVFQGPTYIHATPQPHFSAEAKPGIAPPLPSLVIGREKELHDLKSRLGITDGEKRSASVQVLTAVRGWPGVGKTTLAATLAHDPNIKAAFSDGILWTSLGPEPDLLSELTTWGYALGADNILNVRTPSEASIQLAALLRNKRMLLIVDDVWKVEHAVPFQVGGGGCATLITTRASDVAQALAPTPYDIYKLSVLTDENALELLKTLAPTVVEQYLPESLELVRDLEGLPLALQVAGRLLNVETNIGWGVTELLAELHEGTKLLEAKAPADRVDLANETTPTVAVLLQKSTDRLDPETRERFASLAVFAPKPATFDLDAMAAVWNVPDPKPIVRDLESRGLLEPAIGRFQMHALLVMHGKSLFTAGLQESYKRHAQYYSETLRAANERYKQGGENIPEALAQFDREWEQIKLGQVRAATSTRESEDLLELGTAYPLVGIDLLILRQHPRVRIDWLEEALKKVAQLRQQRKVEGLLLDNLGLAYSALGQMEKAIEYHERALKIAQATRDRRSQGNCLGGLGLAYSALGQVERAIAYYKQALKIAQEIGDQRDQEARLGSLGIAYSALGEAKEAIVYYKQALKIAQKIGDRHGEGNHLSNLGQAYSVLGQIEKAIDYNEQALKIAQEIGDQRGEENRLGNLGQAYSVLGQIEKAIDYNEQALKIAQEIGDRHGEGVRRGSLGLIYKTLKQMEQAIEYYEQALAISREIGDRRNEGIHLGNLGTAYRDTRKMEQAIEYYEQALAISREIGDRRNKGIHLGNLGTVYRNLGKLDQAIEYYEQALAISQEIGDQRNKGILLGNLGDTYRDLGELDQAIEYYEQALAISQKTNDRYNENLYLGNLGDACRKLDRAEQAIEYYRQALIIAQEIDDQHDKAVHLGSLGEVYAALGQEEVAIQHLQEALDIFEAIDSPNKERARKLLTSIKNKQGCIGYFRKLWPF